MEQIEVKEFPVEEKTKRVFQAVPLGEEIVEKETFPSPQPVAITQQVNEIPAITTEEVERVSPRIKRKTIPAPVTYPQPYISPQAQPFPQNVVVPFEQRQEILAKQGDYSPSLDEEVEEEIEPTYAPSVKRWVSPFTRRKLAKADIEEIANKTEEEYTTPQQVIANASPKVNEAVSALKYAPEEETEEVINISPVTVMDFNVPPSKPSSITNVSLNFPTHLPPASVTNVSYSLLKTIFKPSSVTKVNYQTEENYERPLTRTQRFILWLMGL